MAYPNLALFKSGFCVLGGGRERPCLRSDEGGPSLGANPPERTSKIPGFEYSLDFFWLLFCVKYLDTKK